MRSRRRPVDEEGVARESPPEECRRKAGRREEEEGGGRGSTTRRFPPVPRFYYCHTVMMKIRRPALVWAHQGRSRFPLEKEDTNTYIACHRIGWPGTESYNQCLNLPAMQMGDEIFLADTMGRVYEYRISELRAVKPSDSWITNPVAGKDVVSLQTCTETLEDWWTLGPGLYGGGPESGRFVAQAERV